jgi:hypothetical protein
VLSYLSTGTTLLFSYYFSEMFNMKEIEGGRLGERNDDMMGEK